MGHPASIHLDEIHRFSTLLADAAISTDLAAAVPTCGDWTMADLVWHMTEVQDFWTFIISNRPTGPDTYQRPDRASNDQLIANFRTTTVGLVAALEPCSVEDTAWSWAPEQTVGFTMRRQVHEALTHCIDALLATGQDLPEVSAELAADGIDEMVTVMLAEFQAPRAGGDSHDADLVLHATDTNDRWTLSLDATEVKSGSCEIAGQALSLNLWLWGRTDSSALTVTGDAGQAAQLRQAITAKTQ